MNKVSAVLLTLLVILGIFVRVLGVSAHGLGLYDEAAYALVARDEAAKYSAAAHDLAYLTGVANAPSRSYPSPPYFFMAKPVYSLLIAGLSSILGERDYIGNIVSSLSGILFLPLLYGAASRLRPEGKGPAIFAVSYAALSPFLVNYSHLALAESLYILLHLLYIFLLLGILGDETAGGRGSHIAAGLIAGLTLTTHYRFVVPFIISLASLFLILGRRSMRGIITISVLSAVPFLVFHAADRAVITMAGAAGSRFNGPDILDQILTRYSWDRTRPGISDFTVGWSYILRLESFAPLVFLIGAAIFLFRRRRTHPAGGTAAFLLISLTLILLYTSFTEQVRFPDSRYLRNFTSAAPYYYLLFGLFLSNMAELLSRRSRPVVTALLAAGALVVYLPFHARAISFRSGFREAFAAFEEDYGPAGLSTAPAIGMFYLGKGNLDHPFSPFSHIESDALLVDDPSEAAKYGVSIPGIIRAEPERAVMIVEETLPRPPIHPPLLMEYGMPLDLIDSAEGGNAPRRFLLGRLVPPSAAPRGEGEDMEEPPEGASDG